MTNTTRTRRALIAVFTILGVQAVAWFVYLQVETSRGTELQAPFQYERLDRRPSLPAVALIRPNGSILHLQELRGRPVLLHFWSTSCPPCQDELPSLLRLARTQPGLRVVAVAVDDNWLAVQKFFGGPIPSDVVRDPGAALVKRYQVSELPDTYLFDTSGVARFRFAGARAWQSPEALGFLETHSPGEEPCSKSSSAVCD